MAHRDLPHFQFADFAIRQTLRRLPPTAWTEQIALWWGARYRAGPAMVRLRNGTKMLVEPLDYLRTSLYYLGTFEPHCLRLLPRLIGPGSTMVDAGANLGVYTLTAAKIVGSSGRVIAIEPMPTTAAALRSNIELNGFSWVTMVEVALGSAEGWATLVLPPGGNSGMYSLASHGESLEQFRVPLISLDQVLAEAQTTRVDLVKMDIEGSEFSALQGAVRLLKSHRPSFIIELNEAALQRNRSSANAIQQLFCESGYRGWIVERSGIRPLGDIGLQDCIECVFIHKDSPVRLTSRAIETSELPRRT